MVHLPLPHMSDYYDRVMAFRKFGWFYKVQCEYQLNQLKVKQFHLSKEQFPDY